MSDRLYGHEHLLTDEQKAWVEEVAPRWLSDGLPSRKKTTPPASPAIPSTDDSTPTGKTPTPITPEESDTKTASVLSSEMRAVGAYRNGAARAARRQA